MSAEPLMLDREVREYRESALLAREQAEATRYAEIKRALLKAAAEYERLANYVENLGPEVRAREHLSRSTPVHDSRYGMNTPA